jgi:hypothetical protein
MFFTRSRGLRRSHHSEMFRESGLKIWGFGLASRGVAQFQIRRTGQHSQVLKLTGTAILIFRAAGRLHAPPADLPCVRQAKRNA